MKINFFVIKVSLLCFIFGIFGINNGFFLNLSSINSKAFLNSKKVDDKKIDDKVDEDILIDNCLPVIDSIYVRYSVLFVCHVLVFFFSIIYFFSRFDKKLSTFKTFFKALKYWFLICILPFCIFYIFLTYICGHILMDVIIDDIDKNITPYIIPYIYKRIKYDNLEFFSILDALKESKRMFLFIGNSNYHKFVTPLLSIAVLIIFFVLFFLGKAELFLK